MKKITILFLCGLAIFMTGCGKKESKLNNISLEDMLVKVYSGLENNKLPNLMNTEVTKENMNYYLGVTSLDYKEAMASEPMIGSIPHSVVLVRMNDGADIEKAKKEIKEKINPRKWICVEVDPNNVIVDSKDNVIILIMVNENTKQIHDNFKKL